MMCGRTCLTLEPKDLKSCCRYKKNEKSNPTPPRYRNEFNCGKKYQPSYNVAPTEVTPVLVSAAHFDESADPADRLLVPMMWGMVPRWHKGDFRKHGLTTNNCRLEGLAISKLYGPPLAAGQRCVILCEGFYEWQTVTQMKASERPAFYVHMPQSEKVKMEDRTTWNADGEQLRLLRMAGLFDIWEDEHGDKLYSYSVITFETKGEFATIHHRSPAILETDDQVTDWLNFKRVSTYKAIDLLQQPKTMQWFRVSKQVNSSRNKSDQCNKPLLEGSTKSPMRKSKLMQYWLTGKKRKVEDTGDRSTETTVREELEYEPQVKKPKPDHENH